MNPDRSPHTGSADRAPERPTDTVVTFRRPTARRFRREAQDGSMPRGEILLFTGVRYERIAEPETPVASLRRRRS